MKRTTMLGWALAVTLFSGVATACGDDGGDDPATTEAPADTSAGDETGGDETGGDESGGDESGDTSANPDVQAYCDSAEELAAELEAVMADPTSGDVASLTAAANDLAAKAVELTSASPDDVDEINACSSLLTEALTPG